jgi:hypothetical protein
MLFGQVLFTDPLMATIEHGDAGAVATPDELRLAHRICNGEHALAKGVREGRTHPRKLRRFWRRNADTFALLGRNPGPLLQGSNADVPQWSA